MFYTFIGAFIGYFCTYIICRLLNIKFGTHGYFLNDGPLIVMFGIIICAAVGFGYGLRSISTGSCIITRLLN